MNQYFGFLLIFMFGIGLANFARAEDQCPSHTDPVYCKLAQGSGGRVYKVDNSEDMSKVNSDDLNKKSQVKHEYSVYSKNIGCDEFSDPRSREICNSISDNLEWEWSGHATFSPGWKVTLDSVRSVYCDKKLGKDDLPTLTKMCGRDIQPNFYCSNSLDFRLASGIEFLIKAVIGREQTPEDIKGSVFDAKGQDYFLKDGCKP